MIVLLVVVVVVALAATVLAYRNRPESSIESGISSFRREMRALAPPDEHDPGVVTDDADRATDEVPPEPPADGPRPDDG